MQTGLPTEEILPFSEVFLEPSKVNISDDGKTATTFEFESPVYLSGSTSYSIVLLSASNEYNVWISRMGEEDISTINRPDSEKIIVSQQPTLGSLFKSQNGATWDPSQLEDLKFVLYKANFTIQPGSIQLHNPDLDIGNDQIASLPSNPISAKSKTNLINLSNGLNNTQQGYLSPGITITQNNNSNFTGSFVKKLGAIGISSTLSIANPGTGYTSTSKLYTNILTKSVSGNGFGARIDLQIVNSVAVAATVTQGGSGYSEGDLLTVDSTETDGLGKKLIISIPNNAGIISAYNSLLVTNIQGSPLIDQVNPIIIGSNTANSVFIDSLSDVVTTISDIPTSFIKGSDGLHIKVNHPNHGMYAANNIVTISGVESDIPPTTLSADYSQTATTNISVGNTSLLGTFENVAVSENNPGYILIGSEIIKYTNVSGNFLTGITREIDDTLSSSYNSGLLVFKYEFNGVSLRRINKSHKFTDIDLQKYPIEIDSYYIKIDQTSGGVDRSSGNANSYPELYLKENKSGGNYINVSQQKKSLYGIKATQNIPFNLIRPNIQALTPQSTTIDANVRTFSGTSVNGNQISFVDQGFEKISLNSNNYFDSTRIIASIPNQNDRLDNYPQKRSLTLELSLKTNNPNVSPIIDLDRVNIVTTFNRINDPIEDFIKDRRVNENDSDPNAAIYISKPVFLDKTADSLKVLFDAYRDASNDIRVLYKLFRMDSNINDQIYELFPGYENLDINGNIINQSEKTGHSDRFIPPSETENDFLNYEYNAKNLPAFNGFQIKIIMAGTNSSKVPLIKDFRAIATV
jgi:hypothetical protein